MEFNIKLDTTEKFKDFWEWMAEEMDTFPLGALWEFRFEGHELFDRVEDESECEYDDELHVWKDVIDPYYLTTYHIDYSDDWDRCGDIKVRMAIRIEDFITVESLKKDLPELRARRLVIAKKYDLANMTKNYDVGPTQDEMAEMKKLDETLTEVYGI